MNVLFLDYDGVVNNNLWYKDEYGNWDCRFNFPNDESVNNFQAVQWVSEFCEQYDYKIVVTSTWREFDNYQECLRNAGLRDDVEILGKTPQSIFRGRSEEICKWIMDHPETESFIVLDDDLSHLGGLEERVIKCELYRGFGAYEYDEAVALHNKLTWFDPLSDGEIVLPENDKVTALHNKLVADRAAKRDKALSDYVSEVGKRCCVSPDDPDELVSVVNESAKECFEKQLPLLLATFITEEKVYEVRDEIEKNFDK